MIANRFELLSGEVWHLLAAAGEPAQRKVAAAMVELAVRSGGTVDGIEHVREALTAGNYGETSLRSRIKQERDRHTAAELDAEQLDADTAAADEAWTAARVYETAYYALHADPAKAAGEAAYQVAQLVDDSEVLTTVRGILGDTP